MISPSRRYGDGEDACGRFFEEFPHHLDRQDSFSLFFHQDSPGDAFYGCFQVGGLETDCVFVVLAGGSQQYARKRADGAFRAGAPFGNLPVFHELSLVDLKSHNVSLPEVHLLLFFCFSDSNDNRWCEYCG
jgi:hypothetical protein